MIKYNTNMSRSDTYRFLTMVSLLWMYAGFPFLCVYFVTQLMIFAIIGVACVWGGLLGFIACFHAIDD